MPTPSHHRRAAAGTPTEAAGARCPPSLAEPGPHGQGDREPSLRGCTCCYPADALRVRNPATHGRSSVARLAHVIIEEHCSYNQTIMHAVVHSDATTATTTVTPVDAEQNDGCFRRLLRVRCRLGDLKVDGSARRRTRDDDPSSGVDTVTGAARSTGSESEGDAAADDEPPRRRRRVRNSRVADHGAEHLLGLTLEVEEQSTVSNCGVQVWRGAFLLADWLLHCEHKRCAELPGAASDDTDMSKLAVGLELGCGVGLCSIILSRLCGTVFATDLPGPVLPICARNVERNTASVVSDGAHEQTACVRVRSLDWNDVQALSPLGRSEHTGGVAPASQRCTLSGEWAMRETDADALSQLSVVVAADVLYDALATVAFVRLLPLLLLSSGNRNTHESPRPLRSRWLWLSLERRIVFSVAERRAHAPAVELFFELLEADGRFSAKQIPVADIPQRCIDYERTPQLELWQIQPKTPPQKSSESQL